MDSSSAEISEIPEAGYRRLKNKHKIVFTSCPIATIPVSPDHAQPF
jgi:hypothetical protein